MTHPSGKKNRPLLGFYILVIYVIIQFSWWSYMLFTLNNEIYHLKTELNIIQAPGLTEATILGNELGAKLHARWGMIIGEGTVFFILLISGIFITRSSFRKENKLNRQQTNFILSITHELRSPLASARLQMETLALRELSRDRQQEMIRGAMNDIDRLNLLVENILLSARIEGSTFRIYREDVDLSALIEQLIDKDKFELRDNRKITLDIQSGIHADIDRFSFPSMLMNVYENAVKYSAPGSSISVCLKQENSKLLLQVADEGVGISAEDRQQVFKKFYRAGREETRSTKGTGLGLYIARYLTILHEGTISIRDNSPKGTIFEISLPVKP
jgi:two-component system phosphate regulon sensor histidine kinase PhoR